MSFRQFNYCLEAEVIRREDGWDHVRHIMAPWCGGDPKKLMQLRRDKIEGPSGEQVEAIKKVIDKLKTASW